MLYSLKSAHLIVSLALLLMLSGNLSAQSWSNLPDVKHPRSEMSAIQYRDDIYMFNGFAPNVKIEDSVEKFDAGTKQWNVIKTTTVDSGTAVTHNGIVRHGKDVWIIGGRVGSHPGAVSKKVWIFNLDTYTWRRGPDMPTPVAAGGAALVNNKIHWFGGLDTQAKCDVGHHYTLNLNTSNPQWQNISGVASMPTPRNHFATVVVNNQIYALGGQFGHGGCPGKFQHDTNLAHAFDPATNTWTRKADLLNPESHMEPSTFVHEGFVYMVGGQTKGKDINRYDPITDVWTKAGTLPRKLLAPVARVLDGKLVVAAGGAPDTVHPTNDVITAAINLPTQTDSTGTSDDNTSDGSSDGNNIVNTTLSVEAEYYDSIQSSGTHTWQSNPLAGASNNDAMQAGPNLGALKHGTAGNIMMSYLLYFEEAGSYQVWIRGLGDSNGASVNDSIHAGLNGTIAVSADKIDNFSSTWTWSQRTRDGNNATINVPSAGLHSFNLWMREDGMTVDKFVLTKNTTYTPSGTGPSLNDGINSSDGGTDSSDDNSGNQSGGSSEPNNNDSNVNTAANGIIAIEAENYSSAQAAGEHQWLKTDINGASGNLAMLATPDKGSLKPNANGSASMMYQVNISETGIYDVWVRGSGDTNASGEGSSDSVHVGLDGNLSSASAIQNFPNGWNWSNSRRGGGKATLEVHNPGTHTLHVWMREDGFLIDKIVIQKPGLSPPTGEGPDTANADDADNNSSSGNPPTEDQVPTQDNGIVAIEAESFASITTNGAHQWVLESDADASAGGSMGTTPNSGALRPTLSNTPIMEYPVFFTESGSHTVWIRGFGDSNAIGYGKNDSVHVSLNDSATSTVSVERFPASWSWSRHTRGGGTATINIPSPGLHTIKIGMREDGFRIDKIVLAKDPGYTPSGTGPTSNGSLITHGSNDGTDTDASEAGSTESVSANTNWTKVNTSNGSTPTERHEAGMLSINNKLYLMGGRGIKPVSTYDSANNTWTDMAASPIELHHFQPVDVNGKAYVVGAMTGGYPNERNVADVYIYDPASNQWSTSHTIPESRRRGGTGAALHNGKIYVVGGNTKGHNGGAVNWFDEYDPATGNWKTLPSAPTSRDHMQVAIVDNKLVVAGGRQSSQPYVFQNTVATVDVYDFDTKIWTTGAPIPTPRGGVMTVAVGDEVIVIGGEVDFNNQALSDVQAYNARTNSWRNLTPLTQGRHGGGAAIADNSIHVVSGNTSRGGGNETRHHEKLDLD